MNFPKKNIPYMVHHVEISLLFHKTKVKYQYIGHFLPPCDKTGVLHSLHNHRPQHIPRQDYLMLWKCIYLFIFISTIIKRRPMQKLWASRTPGQNQHKIKQLLNPTKDLHTQNSFHPTLLWCPFKLHPLKLTP